MRRRGQEIPSSSNLLLDTLSNALGGVIFIALLVVLLAHQAPVPDGGAENRQAREAATNALVDELHRLPAKAALEQSLRDYTRSVEDYAKAGLTPASPTASLESLLAERERLSRLARAPASAAVNHTVPAIRRNPGFSKAYVVVCKGGQIFSAPIASEGMRNTGEGRSLRVQNLLCALRGDTVFFSPDTGNGEDVSTALGRLLAALQAGAAHGGVDPDTTKLVLYVYPDSVDTFYVYRNQAMRSMPYVIWYGLPDGETPSIRLVQPDGEKTGQDVSF